MNYKLKSAHPLYGVDTVISPEEHGCLPEEHKQLFEKGTFYKDLPGIGGSKFKIKIPKIKLSEQSKYGKIDSMSAEAIRKKMDDLIFEGDFDPTPLKESDELDEEFDYGF